MGRACTVCLSPDRDAIDVALLERQPDARLARKYGVSRFAVQRHSRAHIAPALALAAQEREVLRSDDLLEKLEGLGRVTKEILQEAREAKNSGIALKAIGRAESQLELQARLLGQLRDRSVNVVNFNLDPETGKRIAETFLARQTPPALRLVKKTEP
ncbi:MAG TPA: hypothetical protein VGS98_02090 [Thermoanaerobaculia bacterium]|nr:hypothetical protein [Thermoanaerobaculia bacterium]